jgi:hypothetical protein
MGQSIDFLMILMTEIDEASPGNLRQDDIGAELKPEQKLVC